jgi:hypothetical protein
MPTPGSLANRSVAEWTVRTALAAVAIAIGYISVSYTIAQSLPDSEMEQAHALAPLDGQITALLAEKIAVSSSPSADRARADRLARTALRQDPTAVPAVVALGFNALANGHVASARRLFAYSSALSRRDLATQLWEIQDAVERNDITGALTHYDIALRTSPEAQNTLFPILTSSISDIRIRSALIKTLANHPIWADDFVSYVSGAGHDLHATALFFQGLRNVGVPPSETAQASLIAALISSTSFDEAWSYYASVHPGTDRRVSRDPRFMANLDTPSLFDWNPVNAAGISSSMQRTDRGGLFGFEVSASTGGQMLQQLQMFPPGEYGLEGHSALIEQSEDALPYWVLSCLNGKELGRIAVPNSSQANGTFEGRFTVPAECPVQSLSLVARPSEKISGLSGQIDRMVLHPAH